MRSNRYQLGVAELLTAALGNSVPQVVQLAKLMPPLAGAAYTAAKGALVARRTVRVRAAKTSAFKLAPPTPFNTSITNQRLFSAVSLPLAEVKAIGRAHGASINDMVLWLCSTALRNFLRDGNELPNKTLVAAVPISLRSEGDSSSNNQVSGTVIDLATQLDDPLERLRAIMVGTQAMKAQMSVFGCLIPTDFPSIGSPWLLSGLASLYGRSGLASRLRMANVTISNVPGPQMPLYLAGARIAGIFPLSIVIHGVALNITVQSYMGQLCFGLIACRRAVPDVAELADQMQRAMQAARALMPADAASDAAAITGTAVKDIAVTSAVRARRTRGAQLRVVQGAQSDGIATTRPKVVTTAKAKVIPTKTTNKALRA